MLNFLKQTRKCINSKEASICIVIGNESCDLDSAVSALSLAYIYQQQPQQQTPPIHYLPVLNIPRRDYPLKTEVQFLLKKYAILEEEHLTFRDELCADFLASSQFILVDHHVSPFAARCVAVFDHRPHDDAANLPENCQLILETVGSCATLIGDLALKQITTSAVRDSLVLSLLRNTIILDTVNFSTAAARATLKDEEVCGLLECHLEFSEPREIIFETLCKARADVSTLTPQQLLRKDLKIITNANENQRIALPGFPLLVQQFIQNPGAAEAVTQFAKETNVAVVLLIGMFVSAEGDVQRDIGVIVLKEHELFETVVMQLMSSQEPNLALRPYKDCQFMSGQFFQQTNIKATRKHILPIVKAALEQWRRT